MARRLNLRHLRHLPRRAPRNSHMIARVLLDLMPGLDLLRIDAQFPRQHIHHQHPDPVRRLRVLREQVLALEDLFGPGPTHFGVRDDHIVLADVEEFRVVPRPGGVNFGRAEHFVAEQFLLTGRVLHLLICRQRHELLAYSGDFLGAMEDGFAFIGAGEGEVEEAAAFAGFEDAGFFAAVVGEQFLQGDRLEVDCWELGGVGERGVLVWGEFCWVFFVWHFELIAVGVGSEGVDLGEK